MPEKLDFKDINNSLFLSQPCNNDIASEYTRLKILDMASVFPEIRDHPYSADVIHFCIEGKYNPLTILSSLENIVSQIKERMMEQVNPPEEKSKYCFEEIPTMTWEEVQTHVEDCLTNPSYMATIPEDIKQDLTDLGNFFRVYNATLDLGAEMREEYYRLVQTVRVLAKTREIEPLEVLIEPELRDYVTKLAFPKRDMAEDHLEKLFFYMGMFKLFQPVRDCILTKDENWQEFAGVLNELDPNELDNLIEKNIQFTLHEADRLYGNDTGF